jgi:hypothetical protein
MLKNVLYAPKMAFTLISIHQITDVGLAVHFQSRMCQILSQGPKCHIIAEIPQVEGLYSIVSSHSRHHVNVTTQKLTVCTLHHILGHVLQTAVVEAIKKGPVTGVFLDESSKPEFCEACVKVKSAQRPFPVQNESTHLWGTSPH